MTQEARRPLHRLTPLRDDPAAVWLTPPQRLRVTIAGWMSWSSFGLLWFVCWVTVLLVFRMGIMMTSVYGMMAGLALVWPVRRDDHAPPQREDGGHRPRQHAGDGRRDR